MLSRKLFIIPPMAVLFSSLLILTSVENRMFDLFLRAIPSLKEDPSVLLIRIDDVSLENVGLFPWPRDIMADATLFLREMGAGSVSFDLSYLDRSPERINSALVEEELPRELEKGFGEIDSAVDQVMEGFSQSWIFPDEAPDYRDYLLGITDQVRNSLDGSLSRITRDVDSYFGDSLAFFGNSYLTLTMVTPADIGKGQTFDMSPYDLPWLEDNIALENIDTAGDHLTPVSLGIIPTIPLFLERAAGAGFVNAPVDRDGYRRRLHLLMSFNGRYYGQFAFVPLLNWLGNPPVKVDDNYITLEGAFLGDETRDIAIPRSEDGSVLIQWPKQQFIDYRDISAWDLIVGNNIETILIKNLTTMGDSGFFSFWDRGDTPLTINEQCTYIRDSLSDGTAEESGVTMETYREYRQIFLDETDLFLNGPYEKILLDSLDPADSSTRDYVQSFFEETRNQFAEWRKVRDRVAGAVQGALCIIGVDATSMTDSGMTTFQERYPNVGIHATLSHMILNGEFLDDAPVFLSLAIALILSLLLAGIMRRQDTAHLVITGMAALVLTFGVSLLFFMVTRRYIGTAVPLTAMGITFVSSAVISYFVTSRERSFLRSAFSRYLSPDVISEIVADPSKLKLGGEKRELTALFTDIKGFSTFSEKLDPEELVRLLNLYLTSMSDIILELRGTIDKYEGDAIIAFFGAPIPMEDHASRTCRAALLMKKAEEELNKRIMSENLIAAPIFTRIGINTGDMIVGNMGTANKMDYTIMGSSVNLAARLEGVNKEYGTGGIIISQFTRDKLGEEFLLRRLDKVRVMGMQSAIRLYELLDFSEGSSPGAGDFLPDWERALDKYEGQDFAGARAGFESILGSFPDDGVARVFLNRCDEYLKNPPPADWDGVYT
ncbi:MAG: adenylate/guanylate cyclase domain-containing protein, partial [Spirochaetales bacterium]|nr:adenylate/guanylate cyclase domain-containing protein [Spirochaetales bacterium]